MLGLSIPGLAVQLFRVPAGCVLSEPLVPESDGYIGRLQMHDRVRIVVDVARTILGAQVRGVRRHITVLHDHAEGASDQRRMKFQVVITDAEAIALQRDLPSPVRHPSRPLYPFPSVQTANVHLLDLADDGMLTMWKLGIISQLGNMFFLTRRHYRMQCYAQDDGSITCPLLPKWTELPAVLERMRFGRTVNLPSIETLQEPSAPELISGSETEGVVSWFDSFYAGGCGVILTPKGSAWVHWSGIEPTGKSHLRMLEAGDRVTWASLLPQEGERVNKELLWKISGVRRLSAEHPMHTKHGAIAHATR